MSIRPPVCPSVRLFDRPTVRPPVCHIHLSDRRPSRISTVRQYVYVHPSDRPSNRPSVRLNDTDCCCSFSVYQTVRPSIRPSDGRFAVHPPVRPTQRQSTRPSKRRARLYERQTVRLFVRVRPSDRPNARPCAVRPNIRQTGTRVCCLSFRLSSPADPPSALHPSVSDRKLTIISTLTRVHQLLHECGRVLFERTCSCFLPETSSLKPGDQSPLRATMRRSPFEPT